jgi:hypothetical protein
MTPRALKLLAFVFGFGVAIAACTTAPQRNPAKASMKDMVFLTRSGCVNTVTMRANLDEALKTLKLPNAYQFVDADTLAATDPRGGYGTPTVLYAGRDLFDMPEPPVPHPPPT